jgi:molybdopterin-guanine dinucleotide biosynthesis protein A
MIDLAAVVVCGGRSSRMGQPKAWLPFGDQTLLQRVVGRLREVSDHIVVVAAPDQALPELPDEVSIAHDPVEGRGPLQGIAVGLEALGEGARYAFVSSTDAPFLAPAFVQRLRALCHPQSPEQPPWDIVVPRVDGYHHPLAAIYATTAGAEARALLDDDRRRPFFLFERMRTRVVERELLLADEGLLRADPTLESLRNLNTPEDYRAALGDAGLAAPG